LSANKSVTFQAILDLNTGATALTGAPGTGNSGAAGLTGTAVGPNGAAPGPTGAAAA